MNKSADKKARWLASLRMGSLLRLLVFQAYCALGAIAFYWLRIRIFPDGKFVNAVYWVNIAGGVVYLAGGWMILAWTTRSLPWKMNTLDGRWKHLMCHTAARILFIPVFGFYIRWQIAPEQYYYEGLGILFHHLHVVYLPVELGLLLCLTWRRNYPAPIRLIPAQNTVWRWAGHVAMYLIGIFEVGCAAQYIFFGGLLYEAACSLLLAFLICSAVSGQPMNQISVTAADVNT